MRAPAVREGEGGLLLLLLGPRRECAADKRLGQIGPERER